jgi:hypothetical protein
MKEMKGRGRKRKKLRKIKWKERWEGKNGAQRRGDEQSEKGRATSIR